MKHYHCQVGLLLFAALLGCGKSEGPQRYEVHGTVRYNGEPTPAGQVTLEPDTSQNNQGPAAFGTITDGQYCTHEDRGAIGGPHRVTIVGYNAAPGTVPDDQIIMLYRHETTLDLPHEPTMHDFDIPLQD